jgi:hypothetical protein
MLTCCCYCCCCYYHYYRSIGYYDHADKLMADPNYQQ